MRTPFVFLEDFLKGNLGLKESPDHFQYLSVQQPLGFSVHFGLLASTIANLPPFVKSKVSDLAASP